MSDITPLPKIRKYIRGTGNETQNQNVTNGLVHTQFKVQYFNEKTDDWNTIRFATATYVLRDVCTDAVRKHQHLLQPGFNSFKYQSLLVIENIYNEALDLLEKGHWAEIVKSTVGDMLKATEFPGEEGQDKWLFFWIMGQVRHKLNRRGKAKGSVEEEAEPGAGPEAEASSSTSSSHEVSSPVIRRAERAASDAGGRKVEQIRGPESREEKEFQNLDGQRKQHSKAPRISNIIHEKDEFPTRQPSWDYPPDPYCSAMPFRRFQ
ncbi:hypothetical protein TWF481_010346 [Arthrobotrys musiformis]|uniref:Uncharacterized protein n=1 Tax=Arthrobotrys musiformis TaxID=47236 RepID=A0AAV9W3D0_9PEZI